MNTSLFLALDILWMPRKKGHIEKTINIGQGTDLLIKVFPMYDGQKLYNIRYDIIGSKDADQPGIRLDEQELRNFMCMRYIDMSAGWQVIYE